jgi:hypothetical protein
MQYRTSTEYGSEFGRMKREKMKEDLIWIKYK